MSKEYNINCDSCQEYMAIINAVTYGSASSNNKIEEKKCNFCRGKEGLLYFNISKKILACGKCRDKCDYNNLYNPKYEDKEESARKLDDDNNESIKRVKEMDINDLIIISNLIHRVNRVEKEFKFNLFGSYGDVLSTDGWVSREDIESHVIKFLCV